MQNGFSHGEKMRFSPHGAGERMIMKVKNQYHMYSTAAEGESNHLISVLFGGRSVTEVVVLLSRLGLPAFKSGINRHSSEPHSSYPAHLGPPHVANPHPPRGSPHWRICSSLVRPKLIPSTGISEPLRWQASRVVVSRVSAGQPAPQTDNLLY